MRKRLTPSLVISCLALFIALGSAGYAANGGNFILGQANTATNQTQLSSTNASLPTLNVVNTGGRPAARFQANGGKAPFTVSNSTKIANLNADLLDGLDSTAFLRRTEPAADVACSGCIGAGDLAPDSNWHYFGDPGEPALQSGWVNYDGSAVHTNAIFQHAAYYKDKSGIVHLGGLVKNGAIGQTVFSLPGTGLCPFYFRAYPVISNNAIGRVTMTFAEGNGFCRLVIDAGNTAWVSLDGISYRTWDAGDASAASSLDALGRKSPSQARLP